jgi:hypothetical protein
MVALLQREGFLIVGAGADRAHDRLVWLIRHSGADGFESAEARYHELPERLSQHPNLSDFVEAATLHMVEGLM